VLLRPNFAKDSFYYNVGSTVDSILAESIALVVVKAGNLLVDDSSLEMLRRLLRLILLKFNGLVDSWD
jgi:hypothetical protein